MKLSAFEFALLYRRDMGGRRELRRGREHRSESFINIPTFLMPTRDRLRAIRAQTFRQGFKDEKFSQNQKGLRRIFKCFPPRMGFYGHFATLSNTNARFYQIQ